MGNHNQKIKPFIQRSRVALVQGDCQCLDTLRTEVDQKLDVLFQRWVWGFHQGFSHVVRKFVVFKLTNDATRMWCFIKLKGLIFMKPMDSKQHAWKKRFCNHMSCWSCSVNRWREFPWFEKKSMKLWEIPACFQIDHVSYWQSFTDKWWQLQLYLLLFNSIFPISAFFIQALLCFSCVCQLEKFFSIGKVRFTPGSVPWQQILKK